MDLGIADDPSLWGDHDPGILVQGEKGRGPEAPQNVLVSQRLPKIRSFLGDLDLPDGLQIIQDDRADLKPVRKGWCSVHVLALLMSSSLLLAPSFGTASHPESGVSCPMPLFRSEDWGETGYTRASPNQERRQHCSGAGRQC